MKAAAEPPPQKTIQKSLRNPHKHPRDSLLWCFLAHDRKKTFSVLVVGFFWGGGGGGGVFLFGWVFFSVQRRQRTKQHTAHTDSPIPLG